MSRASTSHRQYQQLSEPFLCHNNDNEAMDMQQTGRQKKKFNSVIMKRIRKSMTGLQVVLAIRWKLNALYVQLHWP